MQPGDRLGPYEIVAPLGAGGMGEVYRARDTRLDRDVAVKVLPAAVAGNADTLARFDREAKAVASLSHPNILALHDLGQQDGVVFAVMELLDGETLRDALGGSRLPLRKAVDYARQVARGLGAAHDRGIVHRDVKPENLFVTRDGRIKILDFGLARGEDVPGAVEPDSPTRTSLTEPGTVLGTVNYMSPEQARGETSGASSDIFSLGTVLYEMLTGKRPFERDTAPETMTAILREDPPAFEDGERSVPPAVQRIVLRCLEKEPAQRFHSAEDLAFALESASQLSGDSGAVSATVGPVVRPARRALVPLVVVAVAVLALGWWLGRSSAPETAREPLRIRPLTFSGKDRNPTVSPDGKMIAFSSRRGGRFGIWIKQLRGGGEAPLTSGADLGPRFSPDGSSVLFIRQNDDLTSDVFRVPVVGGGPRKIVDDANAADWSPDGERIVFTRNNRDGRSYLLTVLADGSDERELLSEERVFITWPRWSPDGKTIAFVSAPLNNSIAQSINLLDVATGERRELSPRRPALSGIGWTGSGELIFGWSEDLLSGTASTVLPVSLQDVTTGATRDLFWTNNLIRSRVGTSIEVVDDGRVVFGILEASQGLQLIPLDRSDGGESTTLTSGSSVDRQPVFHPDGKTVMFSSNRTGALDLWCLDTESGEVRQLTDDDARDWDPAYSADGREIVWSSDRGGNLEIWLADADGSTARQVSHDGVGAENPSITPDGEWIAYATSNPAGPGLWKVRRDGSEPTQLLDGPSFLPEMSPDGRYLLFLQSPNPRVVRARVLRLEDGEILPFAILHQRSLGSFEQNVGRARWSADGATIYHTFIEDGRIGIVSQAFDPQRNTEGTRRKITGFEADRIAESFDVSPDGKRLVVSWAQTNDVIMLAENVPWVTSPRR